MNQVRTRFAPSPTGFVHIGSIYLTMFDYIVAKKYHGQFIIRVEDTDQNRYVEGAEDALFRALDWFGLTSDEDPIKGGPFAPYRQSERLDIYRQHAEILLKNGHAYYCFCTKERLEEHRKQQESKRQPSMYDKHCRSLSEEEVQSNLAKKVSYVVRMKIPENEIIKVQDALMGEIEFDSNLIDDQVLLKSDGFPTYHLAATVDDHLMEITHVIRGREWMPSTPKHVLLYRFFGWEKEMPPFIHPPLILKSEGQGKLSKRDNVSSIDYYKSEGFFPEAILNYLANIVWNHPDGKEIYDWKEFEQAVDINTPKVINITSQAPKFDLKKLEWVNGEYIRKMSDEELTKRLQEFLVDHPNKDQIGPVVPLIKERITKLSDFVPLTDFIWEKPEYDMEVFKKIQPKVDRPLDEKINPPAGGQKMVLEKILGVMETLPRPWNAEEFEKSFRKLAEDDLPAGGQGKIKVGDMFQLIRVAVSGQLITPPLFESVKIIGEKEILDRVKWVVENFGEFNE
ncbi:MAG: glutamate--tRNA ligase [Candidatus Daviesbacteria bacterium]|nr:glutamate--tRNA ligase [Candidatus Daviesbacteria bacterium]